MASRLWKDIPEKEKELIREWYNKTYNKKFTSDIININSSYQNQLITAYDKALSEGRVNKSYIYTGSTNTNVDTNSTNTSTNYSDQNFYNMLGQYDQSVRNNLMLSPNDANALAYKQNMYGALDQYQATADASLAATEMSAYAMLGQQQLELESTIAEQRMKALKSGTTSAQLASQQLANMFAAQSGAAQIANNMMQSRMSNANQFAQSRYGITQDMYNMINANQQTYANVQAQLGAIAGSYASTINQPYAQYDAWKKLTEDEQKRINTTYTG